MFAGSFARPLQVYQTDHQSAYGRNDPCRPASRCRAVEVRQRKRAGSNSAINAGLRLVAAFHSGDRTHAATPVAISDSPSGCPLPATDVVAKAFMMVV